MVSVRNRIGVGGANSLLVNITAMICKKAPHLTDASRSDEDVCFTM